MSEFITHHQVPQPAGKACADWYESRKPTDEDLLYALAHMRGARDALLAVYRELPNGLTAGKPFTLTAETVSRIVNACHAYQALARCEKATP